MADRVITVQGQNVNSTSLSLLLFARRKDRKVGGPGQIADPSQSDLGAAAEHVSGVELTIRYPAYHIITKSRDFCKKHEDWNLCTSAMSVNVTDKKSTIGPMMHSIKTTRKGKIHGRTRYKKQALRS